MDKILIVDDQPEIRRLLGISLGRHFQVIEATDGVSALAALREHSPRLVLLDVMMPGQLDGLAVLDIVKGNPDTRHIPVGMLTARGQATDLDDARARGADAYFTKPFSPLKVLAWVRSALQSDDTPSNFSAL